uniref:GAG-pre-integrase domain-containing protein n=1 Tax=Nicotiana tabacum TaxID=4097 RepID=A0A1S3ZJA4_TOBAC|nr:PREDICTED: uncharacterized protein LOC107787345 [Nicotiana tabacum]
MLNESTILQSEKPKKIFMPNGDISYVTHTGASTISEGNTITNVFYVPSFKFNLLSVSRLTKELQCSTTFFPDFCIFQELFSGKVRVIGREDDGLYILERQAIGTSLAVATGIKDDDQTNSTTTNDIDLWHRRFAHASTTILKKLLHSRTDLIVDIVKQCVVCPCVKQTRLPFSISGIKTAFISTSSSVTEPTTYSEATKDPRWIEAIKAEIDALQSNHI